MNELKIIKEQPIVMIHTCNAREWYVYDYLVPELKRQGLPQQNLLIWHDYKRIGNLHSCLQSYDWCRWNIDFQDEIWHLQDDVWICNDFVERIRKIHKNGDEIVNGFCCINFNDWCWDIKGEVTIKNSWNSYQCIRIKNQLSGMFHDWVYSTDCLMQKKLKSWYDTGKMDDSFWREWLQQKYPDKSIINLAPALVEHIDVLIGGSVINDGRTKVVCRGCYWQDQEGLRNLVERLRKAGKLTQTHVREYVE